MTRTQRAAFGPGLSLRALRTLRSSLLVIAAFAAAGCASNNSLARRQKWGATLATLGTAPGQELEQTYYLGVFDEQEQLPPTLYRVTVRGQASVLSSMRFNSGWVDSRLIDSLNTQINLSATGTGGPTIGRGTVGDDFGIETGRRLMMFGPEGFRRAPADHRLVVVMGASPEKFFSAMDEALGEITSVRLEAAGAEERELLLAMQRELRSERERTQDLEDDLQAELAR